jgi:hypothetical protein
MNKACCGKSMNGMMKIPAKTAPKKLDYPGIIARLSTHTRPQVDQDYRNLCPPPIIPGKKITQVVDNKAVGDTGFEPPISTE